MVDLKEEKKYEQLRKLGQELHIPTFEAFLALEVRDKAGRLIQHHRQRSHSWTRNAYNLLLMFMAKKTGPDETFGAGYLNYKTTAEIVYKNASFALWAGSAPPSPISPEEAGSGFRGASASVINGIVVGSGTDAESFEEFFLQTLITEGTGANQLNYILSEVPTASYVAGTKIFTITLVRYMNNNTVGETSVDVNEVGLIAAEYGGKVLYSRDKLPATVTVPSTGQLKVIYTIQLTYPA